MGTANENGPGVQTGAGNHDAAGISNSDALNTIIAAQAQFLIAVHHVRPELAAMVAAVVFGRGCDV
ncbi:hypothetical protein [Edaphosphingomonas haloaromaticamans]|uniref:Uncharacterized protein n=1 Tax=Edaphosphingomonas haloaromaticamans TaxID=653954 RepID=A0A1S1H9V0_9SPHN|nr:hypothetical protein [Sphingomonas haloaromaticamans]OHT18887.1 hypothetical protein BHE75_00866 [Sphingomonas haloaromaticamans]